MTRLFNNKDMNNNIILKGYLKAIFAKVKSYTKIMSNSRIYSLVPRLYIFHKYKSYN